MIVQNFAVTLTRAPLAQKIRIILDQLKRRQVDQGYFKNLKPYFQLPNP